MRGEGGLKVDKKTKEEGARGGSGAGARHFFLSATVCKSFLRRTHITFLVFACGCVCDVCGLCCAVAFEFKISSEGVVRSTKAQASPHAPFRRPVG